MILYDIDYYIQDKIIIIYNNDTQQGLQSKIHLNLPVTLVAKKNSRSTTQMRKNILMDQELGYFRDTSNFKTMVKKIVEQDNSLAHIEQDLNNEFIGKKDELINDLKDQGYICFEIMHKVELRKLVCKVKT